MKLAIVQNGDSPQIESTAVMLRHAGYEVKICGPQLRAELIRVGMDTVLSVEHMYALGYDKLDPSIKEANLDDMEKCDLFLEIKVRNVSKLWQRWPRLEGKTVYLRVNGSQPEVCPKGGDEVHLPCPIITACLWYGLPAYDGTGSQETGREGHQAGRSVTILDLMDLHRSAKPGTNGMAYTFWPPYPKSKDYDRVIRPTNDNFVYGKPYCMCHSVRAWGYSELIDRLKDQVNMHGNNSPAGQVPHSQVPEIAANALCLVHLKSVDCPGWALYEAMLAGCPVVVGRLLNSRMLAYDLLVYEETCLEFGVPASMEYGRGPMEFDKCYEDVQDALEILKQPEYNRYIGENGRKRLNELMWREDRDGEGFKEFLRGHYG